MKQKGIGLLELMLSLAIIAILLLLATRYYSMTRNTQKINEASSMVQAVLNASHNWAWTHKGYKIYGGSISIKELIDNNLLPLSFNSKTINPWGGDIKISALDLTHMHIELSNVPESACRQLRDILARKHIAGQCKRGQFTGIYPGSPLANNKWKNND